MPLSVRERIIKWVAQEELDDKGNRTSIIDELVILDISNLVNIDASGIACLEELHQSLVSQGKELAIASPTWEVIHKLKAANFGSTIAILQWSSVPLKDSMFLTRITSR
ncbi:hypothetical protein K1719_011905 [Acacia pycnantha]|nr:hypothetical protein K1719_011905 [Acacia pycnantha]